MRLTAPAAVLTTALLTSVLTGVLTGLPAAAPAAAAPAPAATPSSVAADLRARVDKALLGSTAGTVSVAVDVDGLGAVVRRSSTVALPPASTQKLYTSLTALRVLGQTRRYSTQLRSTGARSGSQIRGHLYLTAGGDPYLTSAQLDAMAGQIASAGIKSFTGNLVVDDSRYDSARRGTGWKTEWVPEESGPLSAFAVDRNAWRRDAAFIADPALANLGRLKGYLERRGVRVLAPQLLRSPSPYGAKLLAGNVSAPMTTTVRRVLKDSDNFAAELLLKEVGKVGRGVGSASSGSLVVHRELEAIGIGVGIMADGSGLSPSDRQTTADELSLLTVAETTPQFFTLRTTLPIGCRDGTLKDRFCGTPAAGRVNAKTGTLDTARALTGWTTTRDGHRVRFSFVLSGFSSSLKARQAIDRAVVVLADSRADG